MRKLAVIVAWLIPESEAYEGKSNADIEREILEDEPAIPYVMRVEKVTVLDVEPAVSTSS